MLNIQSTEEFNNMITDNNLVVVDFTATWCGPCKVIGPIFAGYESDFSNITFAKVDVDDNEEIVSKYEISCMPTFKFFKNGLVVDTLSGNDQEGLLNMIRNNSQ